MILIMNPFKLPPLLHDCMQCYTIYYYRNSFKEFETASKVVELLISYCGIPAEQIFHNIGKTGVVAIIQVLK